MRLTRHLLLVLVLCFAPTAVDAGESGDAGALFLRIGVGARASGMGDAFSAVAKDASSVYWNPGAMAAVLGTHLMVLHSEYLQSVRLEQAAVTHETEYGTLGLGFTGLFMDDMDRFPDSSNPTGIPQGVFSAFDISFAVGFSRYVLPNLSAGIAAKSVYEKIDESTAKGVAFDVGLFHVSQIEGVNFAATITNIGKAIHFESDQFTGTDFALPRVVKVAGSFEREYPALRGDVLATLDILFPNDGDVKQHGGVEYAYMKKLFLRGGFKGGYDSQGATFGIGVKYRGYSLDYAVLLVSNDLGESHRIGFALKI